MRQRLLELLALSFWLLAKSERLYRKGRKERKGKRNRLVMSADALLAYDFDLREVTRRSAEKSLSSTREFRTVVLVFAK